MKYRFQNRFSPWLDQYERLALIHRRLAHPTDIDWYMYPTITSLFRINIHLSHDVWARSKW